MEEKVNNMKSFEMDIEQNGKKKKIMIHAENGIFKIVHDGRMIGALKPPGEEWQLLPLEEIVHKTALFEIDLQQKSTEIE